MVFHVVHRKSVDHQVKQSAREKTKAQWVSTQVLSWRSENKPGREEENTLSGMSRKESENREPSGNDRTLETKNLDKLAQRKGNTLTYPPHPQTAIRYATLTH